MKNKNKQQPNIYLKCKTNNDVDGGDKDNKRNTIFKKASVHKVWIGIEKKPTKLQPTKYKKKTRKNMREIKYWDDEEVKEEGKERKK